MADRPVRPSTEARRPEQHSGQNTGLDGDPMRSPRANRNWTVIFAVFGIALIVAVVLAIGQSRGPERAAGNLPGTASEGTTAGQTSQSAAGGLTGPAGIDPGTSDYRLNQQTTGSGSTGEQPPMTGTRATGVIGGTPQTIIPGRTTPSVPAGSVPVGPGTGTPPGTDWQPPQQPAQQ